MKTYGWQECASDEQGSRVAHRTAPWHVQLRCIVAAKSKAEVGRIVGENPRTLFNLGETGNDLEKRVAAIALGRVFITSLNHAPKIPEDFEEKE